MGFSEEHAIETYKSLITISTEAFKALQFLNGGAVIAFLSYLSQVAPTFPALLCNAKVPLGCFVAGLFFGTLIYFTSYFTQLSLHNENIGNEKDGKHNLWLWLSAILGIMSLICFALGAFLSLDVLSMISTANL
jgi:hypothetical protein